MNAGLIDKALEARQTAQRRRSYDAALGHAATRLNVRLMTEAFYLKVGDEGG